MKPIIVIIVVISGLCAVIGVLGYQNAKMRMEVGCLERVIISELRYRETGMGGEELLKCDAGHCHAYCAAQK